MSMGTYIQTYPCEYICMDDVCTHASCTRSRYSSIDGRWMKYRPVIFLIMCICMWSCIRGRSPDIVMCIWYMYVYYVYMYVYYVYMYVKLCSHSGAGRSPDIIMCTCMYIMCICMYIIIIMCICMYIMCICMYIMCIWM